MENRQMWKTWSMSIGVFCAAAGMNVVLCLGQGPASETISLIVEAPPTLEAVADRLQRIDPARFRQSLQWVEPLLSQSRDQPIRVILAQEHAEWARGVPQWVAAYAVPRHRLIVMFPDRIGGYPYDSLESVLAHEMAHVLIGRAIQSRSLPRWFDEGLAMVAMRTWELEDHARLAWAVIAGNPLPFAEIDGLFHKDRASANRAYTLAQAIVRYCIQEFGPRWPQRMLTALAEGQPFEKAFAQVSRKPLADVESTFWAQQTMWKRWVPVVASSVGLWAGIALLAVLALRRQRRRARLVQQQWREDEEDL